MKETDKKEGSIDDKVGNDKVLGQISQNAKTLSEISRGNPFPLGTDLLQLNAGYNALVADSTKRGETRLAQYYGYVVTQLNGLIGTYFQQYKTVMQKFGEKYMKQFEEQKPQYAK